MRFASAAHELTLPAPCPTGTPLMPPTPTRLISQEEIYSSSYAAAAYLESIGFNKKVSLVSDCGA
jgi:hypothetical protein